MDDIGYLRRNAEKFEFHFPELGLIVRGPYAEWVLEAAGEVIAQTERMLAEGKLDELRTLTEFGEVEEIEVDSVEFEAEARFEAVPQCIVSMGALDYHWVSAAGREDEAAHGGLRRIVDMSKTRGDSFLRNCDGVDTSAN